jgi:transketolase
MLRAFLVHPPTWPQGADVVHHRGGGLVLISDGGKGVRVVSFPSWELFEKQDDAYRESVLPQKIQKRLAVEAGTSLGWERYAKSVIALDHYGASAPAMIVFEKFGFTIENVVAKAKEL